MTGLLNRKNGELAIAEAIKEQKGCLAFIDLDNLKKTNDVMGHLAGDYALKTVGEVLTEYNENTIISRIGGDEFAVCAAFESFDETHLIKYIEKKGEELRQQMQESYCCDDLTVPVSASIGIAVAPESGKEFEELYRKADKALYLSKRSGKNQFNIYQENEEDEE